MKVDLPSEIWAAIHALLWGDEMPRRALFLTLQRFEGALKEAREKGNSDEQPV